MKKPILVLIVLVQLTGCTHTINTWNQTEPKKYIGIYGDDTLPQLLKDKNSTFTCKDMIYSSRGYTKKCYVEKDTAQNVDSWATRILATTVAAGVETVMNTVVVAFYAMMGVAQSNSH